MSPQLFTADEIKHWECSSYQPGGELVCARAQSWPRHSRWYLAWMVLIGRFDAVKWLA